MLQAETISISINRPWRDVYAAVWKPEMFPRWAAGLAKSGLHREGEFWLADGPEGPVKIRFTPYNAFGVMDHHVDVGSGPEIHVPMRVVANGEGAQVMLTLYRQPGMSDEKFAADRNQVRSDLQALKSLLER